MKPIIMIDMGHSDVDPEFGKQSPDGSFREWKFNRELGWKIINRLRGMGFDARPVVTPEEDRAKITVSARAERVNAICRQVGSKNVVLISIHANAAGNGGWMNARGWSVFCGKNASQNSKNLANFIFDAVAAHGFKMRQPLPTQKYWQENFTVIYKAMCPAVLTESLFYDNKEDLALLKDPETIQKLLDAHVDGIVRYINSLCRC